MSDRHIAARGAGYRTWCCRAAAWFAALCCSLPVWPAVGFAAQFAPDESVLMNDSMMAGGHLSVSHFELQGTAEATLEALQQRWAADEVPPMRSQRDEWQVLTRIDGKVIESIELRQAGPGRITGQRIRWRPDSAARKALQADEQWFRALLPAQVRLHPPISHLDGGRRNSTLVAVSDNTVLRLDAWIDRKLQRQGYRRAALPDSALPGDARGAFYARGQEEIVLTVAREAGRETAVIHWRR